MEKDSQGKQEEGRDKPDGKAKVEFTNDDFFDPNEDKNKKGNTEPKQKEKVVKAEESKPVEKPKKPAITFEQRKKRSLR